MDINTLHPEVTEALADVTASLATSMETVYGAVGSLDEIFLAEARLNVPSAAGTEIRILQAELGVAVDVLYSLWEKWERMTNPDSEELRDLDMMKLNELRDRLAQRRKRK